MPFIDTLKLGFANSLIIGNTTDKITLDRIAEKIMKDQNTDLISNGLFDMNTGNYNTYYPDVTEEDLHPKDNEYIEPVFRALSEVIVHKDWNPVDFSMNNVLKKSQSLLKGATINVDHEMATSNAVGAVKNVSWQESFKQDGIIIPAGINAKMKIDGKSNPKLARNILMEPPAVHSTSVTVRFLWEKSHASLAEGDFWNKLGSFDKDGVLIRRIATEIKNYPELSLVSHGADPFAQLIKDAGINNPKWADTSYNSLDNKYKAKQRYFFFDYKSDVIKNSIPQESNDNSSNDKTMKKTFLIALAAIFAVKLKDADPETDVNPVDEQAVQDAASLAVTNNSTNTTALQTANAEVTRLKLVETQYNTEKATLVDSVSLKAFKDAQTESLRTKVLGNYKLIAGDKYKDDDAMANMIKTSSHEMLSALNIQYSLQMEEKFPLTCKKCNSTEVNRASAKVGDINQESEDEGKTPSGLRNSLRKTAMGKTKQIKMAGTEVDK